jgi:RNA polymerase sigma factor (sigma-70 family)
VLARVVREETVSLVASLQRAIGDFDVAEEAVQEAVVEALRAWRVSGVPDRPGAWLHTAARRNALDRLRRDGRYRDKLTLLAQQPSTGGRALVPTADHDDRLRLLFGCCHPALAAESRLALTLRAVVGLSTAQIARAFLTNETTVAQRIVRAKRKIVQAGIPMRIPDEGEMPQRLDDVLTVAYLTYNEAHLTTSGEEPYQRDLADDAIWLASMIALSLPRQPEALGLLALLTLQHARRPARFDETGQIVTLRAQDRSRWDVAAIDEAVRLLTRASALHRPGRFQLQAAIAACHCEAPSWPATDWLQILTLYDRLVVLDPSPVVRLNRSIALAQVEGPKAALGEVDQLLEPLRGYHLLYATRAELLRSLGRWDQAAAADAEALRLTNNVAEQRLLRRRLAVERPMTARSTSSDFAG